MAPSGIYWFTGPGQFAQRMSVAESQLEGKAEAVVKEVVERAADRVREVINAGGMNPTQKGGPRRLNDEMWDSVDSNVHINARGRVQGEFGFIDNPPAHTIFQERGTKHIAPMWAYAEALDQAITEFDNLIDQTVWFPSMRI